MKPYVYKILSKNNEYYYGVRWAYKTNFPEEDLFIKYFTSSTTIHKLIQLNGLDYFKIDFIQIKETKEEALEYEYQLIKNSIADPLCLNKSLGKCTIWNDELRRQVSITVKNNWANSSIEERENHSNKRKGIRNHNFKLPPWKNCNGDKKSWSKMLNLYNFIIDNNIEITKYGFNKIYTAFNIKPGPGKLAKKKFMNGWNPGNDEEYMKFLNEYTK